MMWWWSWPCIALKVDKTNLWRTNLSLVTCSHWLQAISRIRVPLKTSSRGIKVRHGYVLIQLMGFPESCEWAILENNWTKWVLGHLKGGFLNSDISRHTSVFPTLHCAKGGIPGHSVNWGYPTVAVRMPVQWFRNWLWKISLLFSR